MNDSHTHTHTHTHRGEGRERGSDKRWAWFANLTPSIYLSLPSSTPSTVPSIRSVILSVPSVLLPLSRFDQSLADPDKRMLPVMEREQRSWLSGGRCGGGWKGGAVAGCQGWKAIVKAVAIHCCFWARCWSDAYLSHLFCLRFPSLSTYSSGLSGFPGARDGKTQKKKGNATDVCPRSLFARLAARLLQARWRSALSAPPVLALVVNSPEEVPRLQSGCTLWGSLGSLARSFLAISFDLSIHLLVNSLIKSF